MLFLVCPFYGYAHVALFTPHLMVSLVSPGAYLSTVLSLSKYLPHRVLLSLDLLLQIRWHIGGQPSYIMDTVQGCPLSKEGLSQAPHDFSQTTLGLWQVGQECLQWREASGRGDPPSEVTMPLSMVLRMTVVSSSIEG